MIQKVAIRRDDSGKLFVVCVCGDKLPEKKGYPYACQKCEAVYGGRGFVIRPGTSGKAASPFAEE